MSEIKCERCKDRRWVCENHDDQPWDPDHDGCAVCGGAGAPCNDCNNKPGVFPDPVPGTTVLCSIWTDGKTVN